MKEKKQINVEIGSRIKYAREAAGLTQEKFAELIQLGTKNVSAIERGVVGISVSTIHRICKVLCISSNALFGDTNRHDADLQMLTERLACLSPAQFAIARDVLNKVMEAFALQDTDHS